MKIKLMLTWCTIMGIIISILVSSEDGQMTEIPTFITYGTFDSAYSNEYEYTTELSELDEGNGRFGIIPEYPNGIYYYIITERFPIIPGDYKRIPTQSFKI